jgi:hypothetical protein
MKKGPRGPMAKTADFESENPGSNPGAAAKIIEAYDALVDRALDVTGITGYYASVDSDDRPRLRIDGETATLTWRAHESDYYGGGYTTDESTQFPAALLFLSDAEFEAFKKRAEKEAHERYAKVREAQLAVQRERQEAHDRAEWERLRRKFSHS